MESVAVQESGRGGPPPPVLASGEEVCLMIEHVTAKRGEEGIFSDAHLTVYVTTLRVVLVLASRPKAVALALRLATVTAIKDASVQSLGIFVAPKVAVKFISSTDIITVFFSTELVKTNFLAKSLQVFRAQAWAVVKAQSMDGVQLLAVAVAVPVGGSTPVGIAGLQRQQKEQLEKTAELTTDASKDLEHLMTHAQEVVRIVDKYARFLQSDELTAGVGGREEGGRVEDESKELETILQSIGMVSPVTKLSAGRKFHEELANELAELLNKEGRLERLRGMVTLTNAYCLLNRARGTELVSPDDLHTAAQVLRCSQHGMQLRKFDSGVLVIQAASLNDTDIARQLVELCSSGCKAGDSLFVGKLATEISQALGLSLSLCKEQLAMAEQRGALCRDESVIGHIAASHVAEKRPNVIIILADDLGYGDLGFKPFTTPEMANLRTPNLENMKRNGLTLTNFHSAAPMCSPARASILVGLFPWRLGVDFIYSQDLKRDGSMEMDHEQLPLLPNVAMILRDAGYYTAHVGKWHLGGINKMDIQARANHSRGPCYVPGINQYGFDEYVSMTEGHDGKKGGGSGGASFSCQACSMRAKTHEAGNTYTTGARYLIRNDFPLTRRLRDEILTDRQTDEAMRVISTQAALKRPFFVNLWFDAPHSPWEALEPYYSRFSNQFPAQPLLQKYASMIANMDMNVGRLLQQLEDLGISEDTLVVFTSDNGPENGVGYTGGFKGRKRLLTEGGIRVPCLWQWKGRIAPGSISDKFAVSTDILPTILHAARAKLPQQHRIDGISLLPVLVNYSRGTSAPIMATGDERIVLWYAHAPDYPKLTAAWAYGLKLIWNDYEGRKADKLPPPFRLFDMRKDPKEAHDILPTLLSSFCSQDLGQPMYWANVSRADQTKPQKGITALRVVTHLHVLMHLFRHMGEVDWSRFHELKHHEATPSCHIRSAAIGSEERIVFESAGTLLLPAFCAAGGRVEDGCSCNLLACSAGWRGRVGWGQGLVHPGLEAKGSFRSLPAANYSLTEFLGATLRHSRFQPLCPSSNSHAQFPVRSLKCGTSAPVVWVNHRGMGTPLALCPAGLSSLEAGGMNANAFAVTLSELLFGSALEDLLVGADRGVMRGSVGAVALLHATAVPPGQQTKYDLSPVAQRLTMTSPPPLLLALLTVGGADDRVCGMVAMVLDLRRRTAELLTMASSVECAHAVTGASTALAAQIPVTGAPFAAVAAAQNVPLPSALRNECLGSVLVSAAAFLRHQVVSLGVDSKPLALGDIAGRLKLKLAADHNAKQCEAASARVHAWATALSAKTMAERENYLDKMSSKRSRPG